MKTLCNHTANVYSQVRIVTWQFSGYLHLASSAKDKEQQSWWRRGCDKYTVYGKGSNAGFMQFVTKGASTKNLCDLDLKVRVRILKTAITRERSDEDFQFDAVDVFRRLSCDTVELKLIIFTSIFWCPDLQLFWRDTEVFPSHDRHAVSLPLIFQLFHLEQ